MSEHTPTPWITDNAVVFALDAEGFRAAKVCILKNDSRDGAFIVRACNSLDDLVAALEAMQQAYYDFHDAHSMTQPVTGRAANANALAIEALIKAKALP